MANSEIREQILQELDHLSDEQQERLLSFIQSLSASSTPQKFGIHKLAGTIDQDELATMANAIHEDCEKVDKDEW